MPKPKKTVSQARAEMRALVAKLDAQCQADVRKHVAKKKPATRATRNVRLRQAEQEVKASKSRDGRLVWREMSSK